MMVATKTGFRLAFTILPALACGILPTLLFGPTLGQWGSNPIWGSYFGLGWCLSASWFGDIMHDRTVTMIGMAWGWLAMMPLYAMAGWLWEHMSERGRRRAAWILLLSLVPMVPARVMMGWDAAGMHLPDYMAHLASSY